jgi:arabinofuranosyltransferase
MSAVRKMTLTALASYAGDHLPMSAPSLQAKLRRVLPLVGIAFLLIWHSLQYNFVTDDAYISFVFSENFAEHGQLVFNHGHPPVEGYTNFLWTFILGLLMVVGLPPEVMSLLLGTAFACGTLVIASRVVRHIGGSESPLDYLAPLLLAMSSGYACWSSGGLETQMFTFFVSLALYAYLRADGDTRFYRLLGIALALAAMTRPEGLLLSAVIGLHRVAINLLRDKRIKPLRAELGCIGVFLLIWAPWFAWRFWYYGHLFPNTYYVKAAGEASANYTEKMHANGLHYLKQWLWQSKMVYAAPLALLGFLWARGRSAALFYGTVSVLLALIYLVYVVRVGGDFMGLHRFVMPIFVVGAIGFALGVRKLDSLLPAYRWAAPAFALVCVAFFGYSQFRLTQESVRYKNWGSDNGIDTPSYLAVYAHDRKLIGEHMRSCFREDDFSIFGGVGAKPYYAKAKGIDVFGLVSEVVAHEVPRTRPRAGHNKWAPNGLLYKTYKPDFVFHCYSLHHDPLRPSINCGPSGSRFWTSKGYEQVTMNVEGLVERGEYYTFFVAGDRVASFRSNCRGVLP